MNWTRAVVDGLLMSAYFNLATAMLMAYKPATFTTSYPKVLQKLAPKNPHAARDQLLFTLLVIGPIVVLSVVSAWDAGIRGFRNLFWMAYAEWFLINLGDFFGLDLVFRKVLGKRLELPGTEGHPCYETKNWMKSLALPEHGLQWPLLVCPLMAAISAGLGLLLP